MNTTMSMDDGDGNGKKIAALKSAPSASDDGAVCDMCWMKDGAYGFRLLNCRDCGLHVHDECYGYKNPLAAAAKDNDDNEEDVDDDSAAEDEFICWACAAVGTTVKCRRSSGTVPCSKSSKKRKRPTVASAKTMLVSQRPTECCLCSVDDGLDVPHAMHPIFDDHGNRGRQIILPAQTKGVVLSRKKAFKRPSLATQHEQVVSLPERPAWVHTLCAMALCSPGTGYLYGCRKDGSYEGDDEGDVARKFTDDDASVNSCLAYTGKEPYDGSSTWHHFVWTNELWYGAQYPTVKKRNALQKQCECTICHSKDVNTYRVPVQCQALDEYEWETAKHAHNSSTKPCCQSFHVGCAFYGYDAAGSPGSTTVGGNNGGPQYPDVRRVYFFPGCYETPDKGVDPYTAYYCATHAHDLKAAEIPGSSQLCYPTNTTKASPPPPPPARPFLRSRTRSAGAEVTTDSIMTTRPRRSSTSSSGMTDTATSDFSAALPAAQSQRRISTVSSISRNRRGRSEYLAAPATEATSAVVTRATNMHSKKAKQEELVILDRQQLRDDIVSDLTEQLRGVKSGATANARAKVVRACATKWKARAASTMSADAFQKLYEKCRKISLQETESGQSESKASATAESDAATTTANETSQPESDKTTHRNPTSIPQSVDLNSHLEGLDSSKKKTAEGMIEKLSDAIRRLENSNRAVECSLAVRAELRKAHSGLSNDAFRAIWIPTKKVVESMYQVKLTPQRSRSNSSASEASSGPQLSALTKNKKPSFVNATTGKFRDAPEKQSAFSDTAHSALVDDLQKGPPALHVPNGNGSQKGPLEPVASGIPDDEPQKKIPPTEVASEPLPPRKPFFTDAAVAALFGEPPPPVSTDPASCDV